MLDAALPPRFALLVCIMKKPSFTISVILFVMMGITYANSNNFSKATSAPPVSLINNLKRAKAIDKPIFLMLYNPKDLTEKRVDDAWGCPYKLRNSSTQNNVKAKKLMQDNFVYVILKSTTKGIDSCIPEYKYEFQGNSKMPLTLVLIVTPDAKIISSKELHPIFDLGISEIDRCIDIWSKFKILRDATNVVNEVSSN